MYRPARLEFTAFFSLDSMIIAPFPMAVYQPHNKDTLYYETFLWPYARQDYIESFHNACWPGAAREGGNDGRLESEKRGTGFHSAKRIVPPCALPRALPGSDYSRLVPACV